MLQELPLPIVSLPPVCVGEPWWLIYLAHEVGHHAQFDLLPGQKLVDDFRDLVASVIPDSETAERWRFRGEEIFADSFSLYMTGSWALWALTELEWTNETGMFNDGNPRYPSPGARLWLMAKVLNLLQLDGSAALRGFPEGSVFAAEGDQPRIVGDLAKAIHGSPIIGGKTFAQICDWRLEDHLGADAPVREWKQTFLKEEGGGMTPEQTLRAARIALSGGVAAWAAISADSDVQRRSDRKEQLAKDLLSALRDSHEPVERGAEDEPALTNIKSQALISTLFHSDPVELGVW
jgi:hypothetical protein